MHVNPDEWTPRTPEEKVMHAFMRVGRRMKHKPPGETLDQSAIVALHILRGAGSHRLSELATAIEVDASTASRLVRTLELAGLVDREPDPDDKRASRIVLTDTGCQRLDEFAERRKELLTKAMRDWTETDKDTFATLMSRFADGIIQSVDDTSSATDNSPAENSSDKENR